MRPGVLFFFPHCPVPSRSGAHERCLALLTGLRQLGCRIFFFGSTHTSENPWSPEATAELRDRYVDRVVVHELSQADRLVLRLLPRYYRLLRRKPPVASLFQAPPDMRRAFRREARLSRADIVFLNYALWDGLVGAALRRTLITAVEVHDLVTLTAKMLDAIAPSFSGGSVRPESVDGDFLREDFFSRLALAPDAAEIALYGRYRFAVTISPQQTAALAREGASTQVIEIPATHGPVDLGNTYSGPPCFVTGPNLFNVQAYVYFARKVLPRVLAEEPGFSLDVAGAVCSLVAALPGVRLAGHLPNVTELYRAARFAVSPVLGTTGQQIKIVQAMACGLPVVAMRQAAQGSPLQHGVNGFLCDDATSFARHMLELWRDRELCRRLGERARSEVGLRFGPDRVVAGLRPIVESARGHGRPAAADTDATSR